MQREICFQESDVKLYLFVLVLLIIYISYIYVKTINQNKVQQQKELMSNVNFNQYLSKNELTNKLNTLEKELYKTKLEEQKCKIELNSLTQTINELPQQSSIQNKLIDKIYNPLVSPERIYPGGRFNLNAYSNYQLIGFIYNENERYPLYGRPKYAGKTDKYEYYIIDESRNRLKIPFKSKNDNELYSGDIINIPGIGNNFNITIYEYDTLRYDPTIV